MLPKQGILGIVLVLMWHNAIPSIVLIFKTCINTLKLKVFQIYGLTETCQLKTERSGGETKVILFQLQDIESKIGNEDRAKRQAITPHTITSNCSGLDTSCMQQLSTIISLYLIPGYLLATFRQDSKKRPSASFMMLALCTAVTVFLLLRYAYSNAYFAMRSEQNFVIT